MVTFRGGGLLFPRGTGRASVVVSIPAAAGGGALRRAGHILSRAHRVRNVPRGTSARPTVSHDRSSCPRTTSTQPARSTWNIGSPDRSARLVLLSTRYVDPAGPFHVEHQEPAGTPDACSTRLFSSTSNRL
jgi:hypothetical protein